MIKKIETLIKLQVPAGQANPSPPIGPALGQRGINIMQFCTLFNQRTKDMKIGTIVPVIITIYSDRSFTFITKVSPVSSLIKEELKIEKGSSSSKINKIGKLNYTQLEKIAKIKMSDLTTDNLSSAINCIIGSAKSMGIDIDNI